MNLKGLFLRLAIRFPPVPGTRCIQLRWSDEHGWKFFCSVKPSPFLTDQDVLDEVRRRWRANALYCGLKYDAEFRFTDQQPREVPASRHAVPACAQGTEYSLERHGERWYIVSQVLGVKIYYDEDGTWGTLQEASGWNHPADAAHWVQRKHGFIVKVIPPFGGCWYCHTVVPPLKFSHEFDTAVHEGCIREALADGRNPDAEIFGREFGISAQPALVVVEEQQGAREVARKLTQFFLDNGNFR